MSKASMWSVIVGCTAVSVLSVCYTAVLRGARGCSDCAAKAAAAKRGEAPVEPADPLETALKAVPSQGPVTPREVALMQDALTPSRSVSTQAWAMILAGDLLEHATFEAQAREPVEAMVIATLDHDESLVRRFAITAVHQGGLFRRPEVLAKIQSLASSPDRKTSLLAADLLRKDLPEHHAKPPLEK